MKPIAAKIASAVILAAVVAGGVHQFRAPHRAPTAPVATIAAPAPAPTPTPAAPEPPKGADPDYSGVIPAQKAQTAPTPPRKPFWSRIFSHRSSRPVAHDAAVAVGPKAPVKARVDAPRARLSASHKPKRPHARRVAIRPKHEMPAPAPTPVFPTFSLDPILNAILK